MYASKPWSFSSACRNLSRQRPLGAEIWSSEKVDLGGSESTCVVSGPKFTGLFFAEHGRNRYRSRLSDFGYFNPFRRYSRSTQIVHVLAPNYFGEPPNFWDLDYHTEEPSDHVTKFAAIGRQSSENWWRNKTSAEKHKAAGNYRSGRPN